MAASRMLIQHFEKSVSSKVAVRISSNGGNL